MAPQSMRAGGAAGGSGRAFLNAIQVSHRQTGNPVLRHIRAVRCPSPLSLLCARRSSTSSKCLTARQATPCYDIFARYAAPLSLLCARRVTRSRCLGQPLLHV
jgi:hypothetical protein